MGHLLSRRDALRISATTVIAGTICGDALPSAAATIPIGKVGREQDAMADFLQATDFMRRIADDDRVKGFADLNDNLIQAIASFGVGELHARRAERLQALKLSGSRSQAAAKLSARYNEKGQKLLDSAMVGVKALEKDLEKYPKEPLSAVIVDEFYEDLREALVDLEVKASDVEQINTVIRSGFDQFRGKPPQGISEYLTSKIKELGDIRKRSDRGAVSNVPLWKIAAIAVAVGVWIWALFRCGAGKCSLSEGLAYFVIFAVAVLITKFC